MQKLNLNEFRQHGTTEFPLAYYSVTPNFLRYIMEFHWHMHYEIVFVSKGSFNLILNGAEYVLNEGDFAFINSGIIHGGNPQDCDYDCIVFDINILRNRGFIFDSFIKKISHNNIIIKPHITKDELEKYPKLKENLFKLFNTLKENKTYHELESVACLLMVFTEIAKNQLFSDSDADKSNIELTIEPIKNTLELIQEKYSEDLDLDQLAKIANLSSRYFCSLFKKVMKQTPINYLNNYRIDRAAYLIADDKKSLIEICYECGFHDYSYFIRVFKKTMKITPKQYKKQFQNNKAEN